MPVSAAGWRIEPPVSVPVAAGASRAETAALLPPEEPPGARSAFPPPAWRHGLTTLPKWLVSFDEPIANWSMLSLPSMPAPASHNFWLTVLSYSGTKPSRMWLPAVVCTPRGQNRSFIPIGTPAILPSGRPAARSASTLSAASSAFSGVATMNALSAAAAATLALNASATSRAVKSPAATPSRIALTPRLVSSVMRANILRQAQDERGWIRGSKQTPLVLSLSKRARSSLDHLRHAVEPMLGRRGVRQHGLAHAATGQRIGIDDVIAEAQLLRDNRGHRLDPGHVDFAELLDPGEDCVELRHHPVERGLVHTDAREAGDLR